MTEKPGAIMDDIIDVDDKPLKNNYLTMLARDLIIELLEAGCDRQVEQFTVTNHNPASGAKVEIKFDWSSAKTLTATITATRDIPESLN